MKKLALTSLLAFMAVSGANAANVIDGNPLYMPKAGHFYSTTTLGTHSEPGRAWALGEEFGYGITDKLSVEVGTSLAERGAFDSYAWNDLSLEATFRAFAKHGWVADIYGGVDVGPDYIVGGGLYFHPAPDGVSAWFNKDATGYTWNVGARAGYVSSLFTVAGHVEYGYINSEMFNWGDKGTRALAFGLDGQFVIDPHWNLVAGVEYTGITNDHLAYGGLEDPMELKNAGIWTGEFGVNYNIDATKYVGLYINGEMDHRHGDAANEWGFEKGFGFGAKFGIDF